MRGQVIRVALSVCVMAVALCGCPSTQKSGGAQHELSRAEWEETIARRTEQIARQPGNPMLYSSRAGAYYILDRHDKAVADYTQALELWAKRLRRLSDGGQAVAGVYLKRARSYRSLGRTEEAIADYTRALGIMPSWTAYYGTRADLYLKIGRREDAIASYLEACDTFESLTPEKRKYAERAVEECNKLLAQQPDSHPALAGRARAWVHLGEPGKAVADYSELIQRRPGHVEAYLRRAEVYCTLQGGGKKAIADASKAIALQPGNATAYGTRAEARIALKQYAAALADAEKAIQLDPDYAKAYFHRGEVHEARKNYTQAVRDMRTACALGSVRERAKYGSRIGRIADLFLAKNPRNAAMLRARGFAHLYCNRAQAAVSDFTTVLRIEPDNADAHFGRGLAFSRLAAFHDSRYGKLILGALDDFDRVAVLRPKSAKSWYDLGVARSNLGLFDTARVDFKRAIMWDTGGTYTKKAKAALAELKKKGY